MKLVEFDLGELSRVRTVLGCHFHSVAQLLSRPAMRRCADELGLGVAATPAAPAPAAKQVSYTADELAILTDYGVYRDRDGGSLVARYLERLPPTDDPDDHAAREALRQGRYSVFEVERVIPGLGFGVRDLRGSGSRRGFVADERLSHEVNPGQILGGRLLPLAECWVGSGSGNGGSSALFPLGYVAWHTIADAIEDLPYGATDELTTLVAGTYLAQARDAEMVEH